MKNPTPTVPPYLEAVLRLFSDNPTPGVVHVEVRHDETCPLLKGSGPCECQPDVVRLDQ
jgi:hypothetical protein